MKHLFPHCSLPLSRTRTHSTIAIDDPFGIMGSCFAGATLEAQVRSLTVANTLLCAHLRAQKLVNADLATARNLFGDSEDSVLLLGVFLALASTHYVRPFRHTPFLLFFPLGLVSQSASAGGRIRVAVAMS